MTMLVFRSAALAALCVALAFLPARAQQSETQSFRDWTVRCQSDSSPPCRMTQRLTHNGGEQLIEMVLYYLPAEDRYPFVVELPLGIMVRPGVTLRINEGIDFPDLPITRCPAAGCLVETNATPDMLQAMRNGVKATFLMLLPDGRTLAIVFSVDGFSAAMDTMVARNRAAP